MIGLAQETAQKVQNGGKPFAVQGGDRENGTASRCIGQIRRMNRFACVLLVEQNGAGAGHGLKQQRFFLRAERAGSIHQKQGGVRRLRALAGPLHADALHLVVAFPQTGGVGQDHVHAIQGKTLFQYVPGGARNAGDDGPVFAQKGVEQRAFARIGTAA